MGLFGTEFEQLIAPRAIRADDHEAVRGVRVYEVLSMECAHARAAHPDGDTIELQHHARRELCFHLIFKGLAPQGVFQLVPIELYL